MGSGVGDLETRLSFEDSLRIGGLTSKKRKYLTRWYSRQPAALQHIQEYAAGLDVQRLRTAHRATSQSSILSHPQRSQDFYIYRNHDFQQRRLLTDRWRGLDNLVLLFIRVHDTAEEFTNLEVTGDEEEEERIRKKNVELVSTSLLQRITLETAGRVNAIDEFNGINIFTTVPEVIDKLTPGKKTRAKLSKSYIDSLRNIFETGSVTSRYIAGIVKLFERTHNTMTMYADISDVSKYTTLTELNRKYVSLQRCCEDDTRAYGQRRQRYVTQRDKMRAAEKREGISSLEPHRRIMEFYKDFLLANEAIKFLIATEDERSDELAEAMRERMLNGIEFLLETVKREAERNSKMLVIYGSVKRGTRNEDTDLYDVFGVRTGVELHSLLEKAADEYVDSERSQTLQRERGNTLDTLFDGMFYDLTFVERKETLPGSSRPRDEEYATQTQFQLQDSIGIGVYASKMLEQLRQNRRDLEAVNRIGGKLHLHLNPE